MYSFKDLLTVDLKPGSDELTKYRKQKSNRGSNDSSGVVTAETEKGAAKSEALSIQQRMKKRQQMRRMKAKIALGRRKAMRRTATTDVLKKRAQRKARLLVLKKFLKGKKKEDLPFSTRASYEKMVNKKQAVVNRIAKKLLPSLRQADRARKLQKAPAQK